MLVKMNPQNITVILGWCKLPLQNQKNYCNIIILINLNANGSIQLWLYVYNMASEPRQTQQSSSYHMLRGLIFIINHFSNP